MKLSELSADQLLEIDAVCMRFERQMRAGQPVSVDGVLADYQGDHASELRAELEAVEQQMRGRTQSVARGDPKATAREAASDHRRTFEGPLQIDQRLGPYRVTGFVGRGGMGWVYAADDTRLGRRVAIKVLDEAAATVPDRVERFARESRAVAGLQHPNIVSLFDVGVTESRPYAVMELLRGRTLRERLRGGPLPAAEVRQIGAAAASALAAAHGAGIIHRDLKPENLFLTESGQLKLLDFGLARSSPAADAGPEEETRSGVLIGTLGYLSPEQARGARATEASDLFSLGCVLYECLNGKRAFHGDTPAESLASILNTEPHAISSSDDPLLPMIIERCLEKDPRKRYASASDLAADLSDRHPVPSPRRLDVAFPRRRWLTLAASSMAVAGVGSWATWRLLPSTARFRSIAVIPIPEPGFAVDDGLAHGFSKNQEIAASIAFELATIPDIEVRPYHATSDMAATLAGWATGQEREIGMRLGADAVLTSRVEEEDGSDWVWLELIDVPRNKTLFGDRFRIEESTPSLMRRDLAARVSSWLQRQLTMIHPASYEKAYQCVVHGSAGQDLDDPQRLQQCIRCFDNALDIDPAYDEAHAGKALTALLLAQTGASDQQRHLQLARNHAAFVTDRLQTNAGSPAVAKAELVDATLRWQNKWLSEGVQQRFDRAEPMLAGQWYYHYLYSQWLSYIGQDSDALRHADLALSLDATSNRLRVNKAMLRWFAGDVDTALAETRAIWQRDSDNKASAGLLVDILEQRGDFTAASKILGSATEGRARQAYFQQRLALLPQTPYLPFGNSLNQLLFAARADAADLADHLETAKGFRAPLLPLIVARHPALQRVRQTPAAQELLPSGGDRRAR